MVWFFFFKQKTAYEMRISDWSSDVCSSDLRAGGRAFGDQSGTAIDDKKVVARRSEDHDARINCERCCLSACRGAIATDVGADIDAASERVDRAREVGDLDSGVEAAADFAVSAIRANHALTRKSTILHSSH